MNPAAWQKKNKKNLGYGLVQWSPAEDFFNYTGLADYEAVNSLAQTDSKELMNLELEYLLETHSGRWLIGKAKPFLDKLPPQPGTPADMSFDEFTVSTCDSEDLALIFNATYERSGDGVEGLTKRMEYAERWKNYFEEY